AMSDYINKMIPSENRATILSFSSMVFSFFMIIVFPLVGMLGDLYSLGFAIKCLGGLGILFVAVNSFVLLTSRNSKEA
ncbi:MAG TPA: MFS transporter, partial [Negativicutes bacterium]|nr:MFS transporter [Negativicutes bacterium]